MPLPALLKGVLQRPNYVSKQIWNDVPSSKLPGCSHTAGTPASLASLRIALVTDG